MKPAILFCLLMMVLTGCQQMPKNTCECLEEAYVLLDRREKTTSESSKNKIDKKIKNLSRHCRHLSWRGSTCSQEEVTAIMKKQAGAKSLWDFGEAIVLVLHRPYASPAEEQLYFAKHLKDYLNRFSEKDTTWLLEQGPFHWDSTGTD